MLIIDVRLSDELVHPIAGNSTVNDRDLRYASVGVAAEFSGDDVPVSGGTQSDSSTSRRHHALTGLCD